MKNLNFLNWFIAMVDCKKYYIIFALYLSYFFDLLKLFGVVYWIIYLLFLLFLIWQVVSIFLNFFRNVKLVKLINKSPISIINGALGTGKTLFATYFSQIYKIDNCYSNYAINDYHTKVLTVDSIDFTKYNKPLPLDNSLLILDEIFLYFNGNNPKETKEEHKGTIPTYLLARQFDYNIIFIGQRIGQHWIEYREIANLIILCLDLKFDFITRSFKMRLGFFQDMDDYLVWKQEKAKQSANGKKKRTRSHKELGISIIKIIIPMSVANLYNSKYLKSVKNFKNTLVTDNDFKVWSDLNYKKEFSEDDLVDLGMNNLYKNLKGGGKSVKS